MSTRPTAYVFHGYSPGGASYVNYHVGWVLHRHFDHDCVVVHKKHHSPFDYPVDFEDIELDAYYRRVSESDITITAPGVSSLDLPSRVPGRKLMYVQGCLYPNLDGFFDSYVFVSEYVRDFYAMTSDLGDAVIPAFVDPASLPEIVSWEERPAERVAVVGKFYFDQHLARLEAALAERGDAGRLELVPFRPSAFWTGERPRRRWFARWRQKEHKPPPFAYTHTGLLERLAGFRYVVSLAQSEGFGLLPLEAMACGCTVVGFHGGGGLDYMEDGVDCAISRYPDMAGLAARLTALAGDEREAREMGARGREKAARFGLDVFERRWCDHFEQLFATESPAGDSSAAGGG